MDLELLPEEQKARWQKLQHILEKTSFDITEQQKNTFYGQLQPIQFVMALKNEPLGLYEGVGEVIRTDCKPIRQTENPHTSKTKNSGRYHI